LIDKVTINVEVISSAPLFLEMTVDYNESVEHLRSIKSLIDSMASLDKAHSIHNILSTSDDEGVKNLRPLTRVVPPKEVEALVKRSWRHICDLELSGKLPDDIVLPRVENANGEKKGRRLGVYFKDVLKLQEFFETAPHRDENDPLPILSVMNFKGGVAKTEVSSNLARYLASQGYRVLAIDLDHQASLTGSFGHIPQQEFGDDFKTIGSYIITALEGLDEIPDLDALLDNCEPDFSNLIRESLWPNLHYIPSNLSLNLVDWDLIHLLFSLTQYFSPEDADRIKAALFTRIKSGILSVAEHFDVVILDTMPSTSFLSLSALAISNAFVIPCPMAKHDILSTSEFLGMAENSMQGMQDIMKGLGFEQAQGLEFAKLLVTRFSSSPREKAALERCLSPNGFSNHQMYSLPFKMNSSVRDAAFNWCSMYELPDVSKKTRDDVNKVFAQIEADIVHMWPSKRQDD
jgi:chromosome partitioning protein